MYVYSFFTEPNVSCIGIYKNADGSFLDRLSFEEAAKFLMPDYDQEKLVGCSIILVPGKIRIYDQGKVLLSEFIIDDAARILLSRHSNVMTLVLSLLDERRDLLKLVSELQASLAKSQENVQEVVKNISDTVSVDDNQDAPEIPKILARGLKTTKDGWVSTHDVDISQCYDIQIGQEAESLFVFLNLNGWTGIRCEDSKSLQIETGSKNMVYVRTSNFIK